MEYIIAKNTEEDFRGFVKLQKEFNDYYIANSIRAASVPRIPFEEQPEENHRIDFADCFGEKRFFIFAKDGAEYAGYITGYIQTNSSSYKVREHGYIEDLLVAEKYRGKGVSTELKNRFFEWLQSQNISICSLKVRSQNTNARNIYKKWGFEVDELTLWKKI